MSSDGNKTLSLRELRTIVQDAHLNFLLGAGSSTPYFSLLGDVEKALTTLAGYQNASPKIKTIVRRSIQAYFFKGVVLPNLDLLSDEGKRDARKTISAYRNFLRAINLILIRRKNTLLPKQANIFTTNVDTALKMAAELEGISANTGFIGTFTPGFSSGHFGALQIRHGSSFNYRSEIPTVNIIHLHGSVAWQLQDTGDIYLDSQLEQIAELKELYEKALQGGGFLEINDNNQLDINCLIGRAEAKKSLHTDVESFGAKYDKLTIVNPEKTKFAITVMESMYYELIRKLANDLERENSVLFVHGFSFKDEHFKNIILRAGEMNPTLMVIIFCYNNIAREEIQTELKETKIKNKNFVFLTSKGFASGAEHNPDLKLQTLVDLVFKNVIPASIFQAQET